MNELKKLGVLLGLLCFVTACGYRFEGGGYLKNKVRKVAVRMISNATSQTTAGPMFTNAIITEIIQKTDTKVVKEADADAVIAGTVKSVTFSALTRSTSETVLERNVSAVLDIRLMDRQGNIIWSDKGFTASESYLVSGSSTSDAAGKRQALEKISQRSAELLVSRMLNNF